MPQSFCPRLDFVDSNFYIIYDVDQKIWKFMMPIQESIRITKRERCRASKGSLIDVMSLGDLPFSTFLSENDPLPEKFPLTLAFNQESGLLQLRHTIDPDAIYNQYWYMSGVNQSMRDALADIVREGLRRREIKEGDIVVDIASNDGTLLSAYPKNVFRVGIDPAKNIKPSSCDLHINTYFSKSAYQKEMGKRRAKIITSIAMFYDLEDPITFCRDLYDILDEDGLWIVELSYLPSMLKQNSFDTICAEHLEYYSLQSMEYILRQSGFAAEDVILNEINGGSFRLYIRKQGREKETEALKKLRESEKKLNLSDPNIYKSFAKRVEQNKFELLSFLENKKKEGKKVIGYGASTKGNTIMAYYGIGPDLLPFVADRNPIKFGLKTITGIPIISEDQARKMNPHYFLAFPYHFMSEFLKRETDFIASGGQFVSPIPMLTFYP